MKCRYNSLNGFVYGERCRVSYSKLDVPVLVLFDKDPNVSFELFEEFEANPHGNLSG